MKRLPHETLLAKQQKLLQKRLLLAQSIKDTDCEARRAWRKARARLAFTLGDVLVAWIESKQSGKESLIDAVVRDVPSEKRELALRLIEDFSSTAEPSGVSAGAADASKEKPKSQPPSDNTALLPFDQ